MAKLPEDVLEALVDPAAVKVLATVDEKGNISVVPAGSVTVLDEETLAFADIFLGVAKDNLEATRRVAVAIYKRPVEGWQIKGAFLQWHTSGSVYDVMSAKIGEIMKTTGSRPEIKAVGTIRVTEVYGLSLPIAGRRLA